MCEITITNLHDSQLNERLWLLLGTLGSQEKHDDGWGIANPSGQMFKCGLPMHWTSNAGSKISSVSKKASMLLGHIRDASSRVPVNDANAHPFQLSNITFVHNGKLTPKVEKDFIMDEEVPDIDETTKKQRVDAKTGELLFKKVGRSDSLIFFEEFIKDWQAETGEFLTEEEKFVSVVNTTMDKFYGKFAIVFIINEKFYICRGKTAELNISFLMKERKSDSQVLGWAINTSKQTLDTATILMSNLNVLDGKPALHFTFPGLLKEETIFVAEDFDVREIGSIKEGAQPAYKNYSTTQYGGAAASDAENFTQGGGSGKTTGAIEYDELTNITRMIYLWMENYCMSPQDIQIMLYMAFGESTLDITVDMLKLFYHQVLVKLSNRTDKKIRKSIKRTNTCFVGLFDYRGFSYPWMINPKGTQKKFAK